MGTVNKMGNITLNAKGGAAGSNGTGGNRGLTASQHPGSNVYMASGGGGGGAGGFGGAASNIGTGVAAARAAAGLAAKYYDLQGRRLSQPSRAGVYINNGVVKVNK